MAAAQRLSVNINHESADVLRRVTQSREINTTEAVRRAIGLLALFEKARENNQDILIRDSQGNFDRVLSL